jgi:glyoxylase-like metal-dependent hydrolase (beta-lactamase superfamily II)
MNKITFYPIGNADCCMVDLDCGKKLLFDFANYNVEEDSPKINLGEALKKNLEGEKRKDFDVVAFTHADEDHVYGASGFFYLEHAQKYQDDDRVKIKELWIPAAMLIEENPIEDARVIREEARYRLKEGKGVRIFSRPERLEKWFKSEGISSKDRLHLITHAGEIVPEFSKYKEGIEFFVHSPFSIESDGEKIDRNEASLILHATFNNQKETKFLLIGDTDSDILEKIVEITKSKKNNHRLEWDIYDIPHHCSYLTLSNDKGEDITKPVEGVRWLLENGKKYGMFISSSKVIPGNDDDKEPPHRQAAKCYQEYAEKIKGEFKVTMEHPSTKNPEPLVIEIDDSGAKIKRVSLTNAGYFFTSQRSPRAGYMK